jgi:hypothetical protein
LQSPQRETPEGAQLFGSRTTARGNPDSGEARGQKSRCIFRIELRRNVACRLRFTKAHDDCGADRTCRSIMEISQFRAATPELAD